MEKKTKTRKKWRRRDGEKNHDKKKIEKKRNLLFGCPISTVEEEKTGEIAEKKNTEEEEAQGRE
jgi:hypothetical protein